MKRTTNPTQRIAMLDSGTASDIELSSITHYRTVLARHATMTALTLTNSLMPYAESSDRAATLNDNNAPQARRAKAAAVPRA
jgi:hypothetical protein